MATIPETFTSPVASDRALAALNGQSSGSTVLWDHAPGDYIRGELREVEEVADKWKKPTTRLNICVEEGTEHERPLPLHSHRVVWCRHVALRRMIHKLDPRTGNIITIAYYGRDDSRHPATHLFRYSIERGEGREGDDRDF